jgi:hypothetical protein
VNAAVRVMAATSASVITIWAPLAPRYSTRQ